MANSPWGRKGDTGGHRPSGGGGGVPPDKKPEGFDFEKAARKLQDHLEHIFGGNGGNEGRLVTLIIAAAATVWLASGIYRVNSDELGVVLRFGQYARTTTPGLNYHLPYPVEQVIIPSVTSVNKVEIGDRAPAFDNPTIRKRSIASNAAPQNREGLMLTGDRNIVDIGFEVQWKIDSSAPEHYLFNLRDPVASIHVVAESAMREVIGRNKLADVLTTAQSKIAEDTKQIMQQVLDSYKAGIEVIAVNLSRPDVPQPVIDEFQDVKRAEQDKQTAESVAEGYRNDIIPRAKGAASQLIQEAEAYKSQVVSNAEGDASRFMQIYTQYKDAKDVTKRRMYLETMEEILKGMPKVIVERGQGGATPVFPLMMPQRPVPAPATPTTGGQ